MINIYTLVLSGLLYEYPHMCVSWKVNKVQISSTCDENTGILLFSEGFLWLNNLALDKYWSDL